MTDNKILARWQGKEYLKITIKNVAYKGDDRTHDWTPDYLNDAAACDSLLDTLVEKGFVWFLGVDTECTA